MAANRLREDDQNAPDEPEGKRLRSLTSFTMVIRQAVVENSIQKFCLALEPVVRRVVQEEVERGLDRTSRLFKRTPQMLIEEASGPSSGLQFIFKKQPSLPMFTENRIEDEDGFPLEILLTEAGTGKISRRPIRAELVVLDGDFFGGNSENWSSSDFDRRIIKERRGRRPLLAGDIEITLRDGAAAIDELKFTDNSSWIRSRCFRIGVRVSSESRRQGLYVREGMTGRFMVKDHRGESYKKHYPPALGDGVWRLEKIGKDGVFHKRLASENINTVQEFLKLLMVDASQLRRILAMSDRNWEASVNHARTCPLGDKVYIHHSPHYAIVLSPICEVLKIEAHGLTMPFQELSIPMRDSVKKLVLEAYKCWDCLEEMSIPLQGKSMNDGGIEHSYPMKDFAEEFLQNDVQMELSWPSEMQNIFL